MDESIGTRYDGPPLGHVQIVKGFGILVLPNVLGHDGHAVVEVVREVGKHEARIGRRQRNLCR